MAGNKKPRKSQKAIARSMASGLTRVLTHRHEIVKDQARTHYVKQFSELNSPMTKKRTDATFLPLEKAIDEIVATGEGNVDGDGDFVFMPYPEDGEWYSLAGALEATCNTFAMLHDEESVAGLRRMAKRLELHMPLFPEDVASARAVLAWMRAAVATMTPNEFTAASFKAQEM